MEASAAPPKALGLSYTFRTWEGVFCQALPNTAGELATLDRLVTCSGSKHATEQTAQSQSGKHNAKLYAMPSPTGKHLVVP